MKMWCSSCACEIPTTNGMVTIATCHCGTNGGQNFQPKVFQRTAACPPEPDPLARSGVFGPPTN